MFSRRCLVKAGRALRLHSASTRDSLSGLAEFVRNDPSAESKIEEILDASSKKALIALIQQPTPTSVEPPSGRALAAVAMTLAIPAIGFGFVDNFLMIIAGDYIDHTIGISLGISTMAAAGLGNLVSDWGGIGLQGIIEQSMGRKEPPLSPAQKAMYRVKVAEKSGQAAGITIGCLLGMLPLLFLNTKKQGSGEGEIIDMCT